MASGSHLKTMEPSFAKLLGLLSRGEIQFIVVGGIAVTLQGYVRLTEDVAVLIEASAANVDRLLKALSTYGQGFAADRLDAIALRQLSSDPHAFD